MRWIIAIGLALALGGCATLSKIEGTTVSAQQIIVAANSFDAIEVTATNYIRLPPCPATTVVCRDKAATHNIVIAMRNGRKARNQLEAYVTTGTPGPVSLYNVLITSVTTLESILAQYNQH